MTPDPAVDTAVTAAKRALRTEMRRRRATLPDRPARSARICTNVIDLCARAAPPISAGLGSLRVMAFYGIGSEPETTSLIEALELAGHTALLPRVEGEHIVAVVHRGADEMRRGAYGIPSPVGPAVDPSTIDVVLVPGLAFTRNGRRLGQGGGYYDRFLPLLNEGCITCGIGFDIQVVDELPSEPHDCVLSDLITDTTRCSQSSAGSSS